ncbi:MAG: ribbon-helix-helix protein, CopG family [Deltaproteobacteria bacterium]|nr:ribbon-helix-helix protein, CopG family [Deltaproteobacteria bacterium]
MRGVRLSDSEWAQLEELATSAGISVSDLIRSRVLDRATT